MGFQRDDSLFSGFFRSLSTSPLSCYSLHLPDTLRPSLKSWSLACFCEPTLRHCPSGGCPREALTEYLGPGFYPQLGHRRRDTPCWGPYPSQPPWVTSLPFCPPDLATRLDWGSRFCGVWGPLRARRGPAHVTSEQHRTAREAHRCLL